jgi:uncharacterized protein
VTSLTGRVVTRLAEVDATEWDACAGSANPFVSHAFLEALEASGSATARTGWLPQHVLIEDTGRLVAAAPLYLKGHSYGEYVFDWGWADAYQRAGGRYYPKLQCAVPFTPVTGPRLMVRADAPAGARDALVEALLEVARQHVTFPREDEWQCLGAAGFLQRTGQQYHWHNQGYRDFDDFLDALASRKRKQIKRERRDAQTSGLDIRVLTGKEIEPRHWDSFFRFYISTSDRKWGDPYLTREFFDLLGERLADRVALVVAEKDKTPVAGALNLVGEDTLYGRNWGCIGDFPFLHFECCYYQAIEFAIARKLTRVEAGAQGPHKIQRGYLPTRTFSAHWIADPGLARAVADFVRRETRSLERERAALAEHSPYRRDCDHMEVEAG